MPNSWKWKLGLFVFLIFLSAYVLVPTFFKFAEVKEAALANEAVLPWYFKLFPDKGINLGLDLRGGIYLEFEVEADKALTNKIDSVISDIERYLKKENLPFESIKQDVKTHSITVFGLTADSSEKTSEYVRKYLSDILLKAQSASSSELSFAPSEKYVSYIQDQIIKQALEKVRNRIDRYGVAEPTIQRLGGDRIAVELPGLKDPDRAIGLIKKAGQLEFKIVDDSVPPDKITAMISEVRKENTLPDDYSSKTVDRINELLRPKLPQETEIAFETQTDPVTKKTVGAVPYLLKRRAEVTGEMLKDARWDIENNRPTVNIAFDAQGTQLFGETTAKNVGKKMAIILDGTVTKAPVINEPIPGGRAQITLGYGGDTAAMQKEAEDLTLVLQEGALPAQLTEATKTIVGPSLGADSIRQGVWATIFGSIVVCVFMLIYYKGAGFIADSALIFNLLFIMSALALFQATLTLPGIAGIALTLGMAVDANVLINERIREELRLGKSARAAIEAGYSNAMRTIIDSNLTTLIAGVVLYQFGTGPIRGFAVTLIIGLAISMYTACICTRMVYDYLFIKRKITKISV